MVDLGLNHRVRNVGLGQFEQPVHHLAGLLLAGLLGQLLRDLLADIAPELLQSLAVACDSGQVVIQGGQLLGLNPGQLGGDRDHLAAQLLPRIVLGHGHR